MLTNFTTKDRFLRRCKTDEDKDIAPPSNLSRKDKNNLQLKFRQYYGSYRGLAFTWNGEHYGMVIMFAKKMKLSNKAQEASLIVVINLLNSVFHI